MMGPIFLPPPLPTPPPSCIIMVQSSLPKMACMHNAAYTFLRWQILFPAEAADSNSSSGSCAVIVKGRSYHQKLTPTEGRFPPTIVFTEGRLPPKVVFHQRSSSTEGCLTLKVVLHQRSTKGRRLQTFVFHRRLSSRYAALVQVIHLNDLLDNA